MCRSVLGLIGWWLSASTVLAQPAAESRYFLVLYGAQSVPFRAADTHAWAAFVKTTPSTGGQVTVHADTISWMPATLRIHPWDLRREPGVNLTGEQTLEWARSVNARITMLGPFEIDQEHYERLSARKNELESGNISYRAIGGLTRNAPVSNCGQSFTRASSIVGRRYWQPVPLPGERGVKRLAARYARFGEFVTPGAATDWPLEWLEREP